MNTLIMSSDNVVCFFVNTTIKRKIKSSWLLGSRLCSQQNLKRPESGTILQAVLFYTPNSLCSPPIWSMSVIVAGIYSEFIPTDPCCSGAGWMACKVNGSDPIFPCSTPHPTHMHTHTHTCTPSIPLVFPSLFSISYTMQNSIGGLASALYDS